MTTLESGKQDAKEGITIANAAFIIATIMACGAVLMQSVYIALAGLTVAILAASQQISGAIVTAGLMSHPDFAATIEAERRAREE